MQLLRQQNFCGGGGGHSDVVLYTWLNKGVSPACWAVISFQSFYFIYCKSSFKPPLYKAPPFQKKES